ncbi:hypothetical protein OU798_23645 [Prolixibacteraceae bacterium Z1-6]|uniref:Uncharacterized protein n=1 Tax=Draconibacterium aestuarii TaxID=2998507 RepID=A0A9X3FHQ6_9BACT|nr:hypothetical protein [Prolixibacteraceae bacterium Z1-6]
MPVKIPVPITFNPQKHHFRFLLSEIGYWKTMELPKVKNDLLLIGNNLIDFYLGSLSVQQICNESIRFFQQKEINDEEKFTHWLKGANYKKMTLSDQSEWLVKKGNSHTHYIHIHPAKFSKHTIRVRAATLKTVIALLVNSVSIQKSISKNLLSINSVREKMLGLSPIKSADEPDSGILRLWRLFENYAQTDPSLPLNT